MNTKNTFSAAQNKSKRTVAETDVNAINATPAADSLMAADDLIRKKYGRHTAQANKPQPSLLKLTDALGKPFLGTSKKLKPKHISFPLQQSTSLWTLPTSGAASASWF